MVQDPVLHPTSLTSTPVGGPRHRASDVGAGVEAGVPAEREGKRRDDRRVLGQGRGGIENKHSYEVVFRRTEFARQY